MPRGCPLRPSARIPDRIHRIRGLLVRCPAFRKHGKAKTSFATLNPGKRREYADYVASAKRNETKVKRIEKILPMIESGVGLHDKYRTC